jgi:putative membrane protein
MSEKWIPPVELEPEATPSPPEGQPERPAPTILAEEGDARFETYVRQGQRLDERDETTTANAQAEALKRQMTQRSRRALQWLLGTAGVLLVGMLALDAVTFLATAFERSLFLGSLFATLIALVVVSLLVLVYEQVQDIRRLHDISRLQAEAERLRQANGYGNAAALAARVARLYPHRMDVEPGLDRFRTTVSDAHRDAEMLALFARQVLHPLDERASRIVATYASQTALMTALSPLALLDAMLSLWRNVCMAREIAVLYGGRPGSLGTLSLVRGIVGNLAAAGVSEVLADVGAEAFGSTFATALSAKVGQGIAMGVLTMRVGQATMRLCRPIPFHEHERPRMAHMWEEVLKTIYHVGTARDKKP